MGRGDSLARQLSLIQLLDERRQLVVTDVARELGYTPRTVYRDLEVLERVGVPIYQEKQGRRSRWRVVDGYRRRLSLTLSFPELLALAAGRDLMSGLAGTLFHESAISALEKIRRAVPEELVRRFTAGADRVSAGGGDRHDYSGNAAAIARLVEAVDRQETVRFEHRKPGRRQFETRVVDPYHLHFQAGALYLVGFDHARDAVRTFLLDRVATVDPTGARFERRAQLRPDDLFQGSFGAWSGKPKSIRLRFDKTAAPIVAERRKHPSMTSQWRSDGKLDVSLEMPLSPALIAWILSWGAGVEVIAPKELKEKVRGEHARAARA